MRGAVWTGLVVGLLVWGVVGGPGGVEAKPGKGFMLGGGLGGGQSNFDFEADNEGDSGTLVVLNVGYAWAGGFALSGELSEIYFAYSTIFEENKVALELEFVMVAVVGWYFFELSRSWEGFGKVGVGQTRGSVKLVTTDSEAGEGLVLGGGVNWYFTDGVALHLEAALRYYGVGLAGAGEVNGTGLTVGVMWK